MRAFLQTLEGLLLYTQPRRERRKASFVSNTAYIGTYALYGARKLAELDEIQFFYSVQHCVRGLQIAEKKVQKIIYVFRGVHLSGQDVSSLLPVELLKSDALSKA